MAATNSLANDDVYHPEWLAFEEATGGRMLMKDSIEEASADFNQSGIIFAKQWPQLNEPLDITEKTIKPEGIKIRIYTPQNNQHDLPLIVYFHGGGFLMGDLETEDPHCRTLAAKTPSIVINVDYPLAPEANMEQIIKSGLRSIEWAKTQEPPLTSSPKLLLAGGSAGGTLALQLGYHFASQGDTTTVTGLILIMATCSPSGVTPYTGRFADQHNSSKEKAEGAPLLDRPSMQKMIKYPKMSPTNPQHFPLLAPTLSNFPRTYIVTAEHDPTRDDGKVLAKRLEDESSNGVREVCYQGMPHWFHWFPAVPMAHVMMEETVTGTKWVLGMDEGR